MATPRPDYQRMSQDHFANIVSSALSPLWNVSQKSPDKFLEKLRFFLSHERRSTPYLSWFGISNP